MAQQKREEDLKELKQWHKEMAHYPQLRGDNIENLYHFSNYDINEAKITIESYCKYLNEAPEIFGNMNPLLPEVEKATQYLRLAILPDRDSKGNVVGLFQLTDKNPSEFVYADFLKITAMYSIASINSFGDKVPGYVIICDAKNTTFRHLKTMQIALARKGMRLNTVMPRLVSKIYVINLLYIGTLVYQVIRPFMDGKIRNKLHVYSENYDDIYENIPKKNWPEDYGGEQKSMEEFQKQTLKMLMNNAHTLPQL